ncbi:hypothetical protein A2U01_0062800, partial [Trifolium medium]|nr:hypothetical protein [Trifolium medium]
KLKMVNDPPVELSTCLLADKMRIGFARA